jgi:hypothetical protein
MIKGYRKTKRRSFLSFGADLVEQAQNAVATFNGVVPVEAQLRGMAEAYLFRQLGAQETGGGVQYRQYFSFLLLATDAANEDFGVLEVSGGLDTSHGNELSESRVPQVVLNELADFTADESVDTFDTM